ncbi:hypothetical protein [Flavobacterium lindanitolerans]|uniref:hypothetical protein n=1 Tax=Flavobacterium lindanitolerans TaxID=428988 RepID=UPI0027B968E4|nr:hypothetical protein [Flavobacterium lindanitolerans]
MELRVIFLIKKTQTEIAYRYEETEIQEKTANIHIGHIYGQGCEFEIEENPQVIEIFKITGNNEENKKQIEKLPYAKNITRLEEKWDFIENYWNANYKKFE